VGKYSIYIEYVLVGPKLVLLFINIAGEIYINMSLGYKVLMPN